MWKKRPLLPPRPNDRSWWSFALWFEHGFNSGFMWELKRRVQQEGISSRSVCSRTESIQWCRSMFRTKTHLCRFLQPLSQRSTARLHILCEGAEINLLGAWEEASDILRGGWWGGVGGGGSGAKAYGFIMLITADLHLVLLEPKCGSKKIL